MKRIAIIGGGAGGLAAAVAAGERARGFGADVEIGVFESSDRVGRTILATGNGRCNFSNAHIDVALYHNSEYVAQALSGFESQFNKNGDSPNGVVSFFERHGLLWREEGEGRLYPQANKASVILDILRSAAATCGVEERTETRIATIEPPREPGKPFTMRTSDGVFERADAVIVACGGSIARAMLPDDLGIGYTDTRPVLCPIATDPRDVRELNNIRVKAGVALLRDGLEIAKERGEVLFRKYGVSGIAVFNLSREAQRGDVLSIDLMPAIADSDMVSALEARRETLRQTYGKHLAWEDFMRGMLLPQVTEVVLKRCGMNITDKLSKSPDAFARLAKTLKSFDLQIEGTVEPEHAQVRRGGFDPWAFDPATMESLAQPGLHVVGEALDVDGPCGGYNLHWAFATGILAGRAAC